MINSLKNMVARVFYAPASTSVQTVKSSEGYNPFENPFMQPNTISSRTYAVNRPVKGGYFAGYYNGKPNIVGRRLFIEA